MIDYDALYRSFVKGQMIQFYKIMYPGLLTFASRILGSSLAFMAEDCVQEAVMTTFEHRAEIEDHVHWRWYLMRSVRSRALNLLRHKGVTDGYATAFSAGTLGGDASDSEPDISYAIIRQETLDRLFAAIDSLPPELRQIFEFNFEQGLRNREIAALLDIAEITVKKRKMRMLDLLRGILGSDSDLIIISYLVYRCAV